MSGIIDPMTRVGFTNDKWGVCGFTSSLYAMYDLNPGVRGQVINASSGWRILAEIKTYLVMLKAENSPLLNEIRDFTRTFGKPYDTFEVDDYIARINKAASENLTRKQIMSESRFSIAIPPAAVADYVIRAWDWKSTVMEFPAGNGTGDGVIGVRSSTTTGPSNSIKPYNGLEHYMYRSNGKIYSWGQSFDSVKEAADSGAGGAAWTVCYVISVTKT